MAEEKKKLEVKEKETKKVETPEKKEEKMKTDKKEEKKVEKKNKAFVNGFSLRVSVKTTTAVCKMISGKSLDKATEMLEKVIIGKMPVRMGSAEFPHQKSRGLKNIAGARFPKKAAEEVLNLVKQLKANSTVNGLEEPVIVIARVGKAARPFKRGGRQAKRAHVYIEAREKVEKAKEEKK